MSLRVIQEFAGFNVGDLIDDTEVVSGILASEQVHYVIALPDKPTAPEPVVESKAASKPKA
ncbi:Uncharacterised protein [Serratia proteamaculans]|uniref:hypothetical protein n=1 Tax=Serratia proteamaculans TaxID=28151 RepID=UPI002183C872|nr:hypothetical protein [Serratia proteamaculans]CAI2428377.1 Uncharacterised protein [Serratia proteamaculans]